jgi:hypothetical protein
MDAEAVRGILDPAGLAHAAVHPPIRCDIPALHETHVGIQEEVGLGVGRTSRELDELPPRHRALPEVRVTDVGLAVEEQRSSLSCCGNSPGIHDDVHGG